MKLSIASADTFRKCVGAIAVLIDEAEFVVDENGLTLKATDPSQISMVDFALPKAAFTHFEAGGNQHLGIDLDYLNQVMSRAKSTDALELELDEGQSRLRVALSGGATSTFLIPLIDISSADVPKPKIAFDVTVQLSAPTVQDALKSAALISTHVTLGVNASSFWLKAHSSKGSLNHMTSREMDKHLKISWAKPEANPEASAMFPLDYLADILKFAPSDAPVTMELRSNAPVHVTYDIGPAKLGYYLAPRIESD
jgi:proliferating cell nuclear antigen